MPASSIIITGFGSNDKVPGAVAETVFGAGASSLGQTTLSCLLVGLQADDPADGAAIVDTEIFPIRSLAEAELKGGGQGCEIALMAQAALRIPNISLFGLCPTPATSPTAASITVTFGGTWEKSGQYTAWVSGRRVSFGILSSEDAGDVAETFADQIAANPRLPVVADVDDEEVTLTWKTAGIRGNDGIFFHDLTAVPSGLTATVAGGDPVTGGGVRFDNGAGTEDLEDALATIESTWAHRIAFAQYDSDNLGLIAESVDNLAAPIVGKPTHVVAAYNGDLDTAQSLGQTTLNNPRAQLVWMLNAQSHPVEIAASMAALRTVTEQQNPNSDYDNVVLPGIVGPFSTGDRPNRATIQAALDNSVTPLTQDAQGDVHVVRAITTLSVVDTFPYYGTLDTYKSYVPDYVGLRLKVRWAGWSKVNRYVRDNPAQGEPDPPANVATPDRWESEIVAELLKLQDESQITSVGTGSNTTPEAEFDSTAERIMARVPVIVLPHQHQTGISVEQQASS